MRRFLLPVLFLLLGGPVCLLNAVLVPPGEVPDEIAHISRADGLRHGSILGKRRSFPDAPAPVAGFYADGNLALAWPNLPGPIAERKVTQDRLDAWNAVPWGRTEYVVRSNTAAYMPLLYVPTAVTLAAAKRAGQKPFVAVLAARGVNALLYLAAGVAALMLARRGRGVLFLTLLLPMSLAMGGSCNQDGLLLSACALGAALLTRATSPQALSHRALSRRAFWGAAVLLAVVVTAKPLYAPLAGLLLLAAPTTRAGLGGVAVVAVPSIAWFAVAQRQAGVSLRPLPADMQAPGPLWPGDPAAVFLTTDAASQLRVLLAAPWRLLALPVSTLWDDASAKLAEMVGVLGRLDLELPDGFYTLAYAALAAALVGDSLVRPGRRGGPGGATAWGGAFGFGCLGACVVLVYLGQYLIWTPVGAARIEGVQGRYFLPLLLFSAPLLPRIPWPGADALRCALRAPAVLVGVAGVVLVPAVTVLTYYVR